MGKRALKSDSRPAKKTAKPSKRAARHDVDSSSNNVVQLHPQSKYAEKHPNPINSKPIQYLTDKQGEYHLSIQTNTLTVGDGPAGTGKSYVAASHAIKGLLERKYQRIIITRPAVSSDEELGFLPGTAEEKTEPYFAPIKDIITQWIGDAHLENLIKSKKITFVPLGMLRGLTFDNCFIMLDEAQNATPRQIKLLLTRVGKNSTVVVDGDTDQKDIQGKGGLEDIISRFDGMPSYQRVTFTEVDIVRSGFVRDILFRYRKEIK